MKNLRTVISGISAGILILVGCSVFLACDVNYVGATFFSVALLCICFKGYALFTGRVGYLAEKCGKKEVSDLLLALLGNTISMCLIGLAVRYAIPNLGERAKTICEAKLLQAPGQTFIRGLFCGVTMYLAVSIYRDKKSISAIFFCVPAFILSGFEHSIADMGYFAISGIVSLKAFGFLWMVILGNSVGGLLLPAINRIGEKRE